MTKKRLILISLFTLLTLFVGCTNNGTTDDIKIKASNGSDINIGDGNNWCNDGQMLDISGPDGQYNLEVIGIVDNGEYKGMCHMQYRINAESDSGTIDYYVDEQGNGFQIMNINGQQSRVEWSNQ